MSRIPTWQMTYLRKLIAKPQFQQRVARLRTLTGASPSKRRGFEDYLLSRQGMLPEQLAEIYGRELSKFERTMVEAFVGGDVAQFAFIGCVTGIVSGLTATPELSWEDGGQILAALWTDYDGPEFELFSKLCRPYWVHCWNPDEDEQFEAWRNDVFQPGRIYVDVTFASHSDLTLAWRIVSIHRRRLGLPIPHRGAISGAGRRRPKVVGRYDWSEVRGRVQDEPRSVSQWERKYVDSYTKKHENTSTDRRRALANFRKNVREPLGLRAGLGRRPG